MQAQQSRRWSRARRRRAGGGAEFESAAELEKAGLASAGEVEGTEGLPRSRNEGGKAFVLPSKSGPYSVSKRCP